MDNVIKEFREKFGARTIWVVPSEANYKTIEEMEQFILSKLKEVAEGCIGESVKTIEKTDIVKRPEEALNNFIEIGRRRHRAEAIDYCNKIGINIK